MADLTKKKWNRRIAQRATVTHAQGKVNLHLDYNSKRRVQARDILREMERQILYV